MRTPAALIAVTGALGSFVGCTGGSTTTAPLDTDTTFAGPFAVSITGYADHAMEPFITRDGQYLLFNNRNDPAELTDLQIAVRVNDSTFTYIGPLAPLNSTTLDGVPAGTTDGTVYFVSLRSYEGNFSTIFKATLTGPTASALAPVTSIATGGGGLLDFDVDVSADGQSLLVARGLFNGGALPSAWGTPRVVRGPVGFVEAGSWSPDAKTLYYHALVGDRFVIRRLARE